MPPVHGGPWQPKAPPALPCKHALCADTCALTAHAAARHGGLTAGHGQAGQQRLSGGSSRRRVRGDTRVPGRPACRRRGASGRAAHPQLAQAEQVAALRDADGGAHGRAQQRLPRHRQQQLHARHIHKRLRARHARCDAVRGVTHSLQELPHLLRCRRSQAAAPHLLPQPPHILQACTVKDGHASHTQELHLIWKIFYTILRQWCMKRYAALTLGVEFAASLVGHVD